MFSSDVTTAMEKYGRDLVNSVMARAEAIYRSFSASVFLFRSSSFSPIDFISFSFSDDKLMMGELTLQMNVERFVGKGEAKAVICNAVEKLRADTLVMGSHGYGFMKRFVPSIPLHVSFQF